MRTKLAARLSVAAAALAAFAALAACGSGTPSARTSTPVPRTSAGSVPATSTPAPSPSATRQSLPPSATPTGQPGSSGQPSKSAQPAKPPASSPSGTQPITGSLAGQDWTYIPTSRKVVALTFDAGANADAVASILATLRSQNVPATFFLTGDFVRAFPSAARSIVAAGMRIGDHTITHPYLTKLSDAAVRNEITGGAQQIQSVTGASPAPLFRFPFGDADTRTIGLANQAGYVPVRWTVDTLGWEGTAGHISASVVTSRVLAALRPGEIVLMHVGSNPDDHTTFDADALPAMITQLKAHGYGFVTLDALTG